jgi:hypothetical protein
LRTGRPPKQFCPKNHDTFICGRNKQHACNDCMTIWHKAYVDKHKKRMAKYDRDIKVKNATRIKLQKKKWNAEHPDLVKLYDLRNNAKRKKRIAKFGQEDIHRIYMDRPEGMEVDHVIPLCGNRVSGLHVSWNLQYLPPKPNKHKGNRCNVKAISQWYGKILIEAGLK